MFGIGLPEILIIAFIVLIIFGAGKLPEIMGGLGKGLKDFKEGVHYNPEKEVRKIENEDK